MEFEADRPRLDVAHPGQQQRRNQVAVTQTPFDFGASLFEQPFARRVLQEAHEGLNLRIETNDIRIKLRFFGGHRAQIRQETANAQATQRAGRCARSEEITSVNQRGHWI